MGAAKRSVKQYSEAAQYVIWAASIAYISRYPAHMYSLQLLLLEDEQVLGADGSVQALNDVLVRFTLLSGLMIEICKTPQSPSNGPHPPPSPNPSLLPSTTVGPFTRISCRARNNARLDRSWICLDTRFLQECRLACSYCSAVSALSVFVGRASGQAGEGQGVEEAGIWDDGSGFRV
jgi:hypothetical protein